MHVVFACLPDDSYWYSAYLIEGVERLDFTGSWTRHPVRDNDCHYHDDEGDDDDDDDDDDLPNAHSGCVLKAWITNSGTYSSSFYSSSSYSSSFYSTHKQSWISKVEIEF